MDAIFLYICVCENPQHACEISLTKHTQAERVRVTKPLFSPGGQTHCTLCISSKGKLTYGLSFDFAEVRGGRQWSEANLGTPPYSGKDSPDAQSLVRAHFFLSSSSGSVPCKRETKSKKMTSLSGEPKITQRTCHPRAATTWPCHHILLLSWPICCKKAAVSVHRLSSCFSYLWSCPPRPHTSSSLVADCSVGTRWRAAQPGGI